MTDERLLALLPTIGLSLGTKGVPEENLVRIAGNRRVSDQLRALQAAGRVVQLPGGGWAETERGTA